MGAKNIIIANDFPRVSIVANCPDSGGTGAGWLIRQSLRTAQR